MWESEITSIKGRLVSRFAVACSDTTKPNPAANPSIHTLAWPSPSRNSIKLG